MKNNRNNRFPSFSRKPLKTRTEKTAKKPSKKQCSPLCPYFKCAKNALVIATRFYRGKPRKVAICRWTGDLCIGYRCQYAYCVKRAMLPDGTCGLEAREVRFRDLLEDIEKEEFGRDVKDILTKRFGRKDMLME